MSDVDDRAARAAPASDGLALLCTQGAEGKDWRKALFEHSRHILDAIPQMVWTLSADGTEFYNSQCRRFTGRRDRVLETLDRSDLIHDEDRQRVVALWQEKLASGETYEARYRLKNSSGEYGWILSRAEPQRNADGTLIGWYGTCTDIHDAVLDREQFHASTASAEDRIRWISDHDQLTQLPNRAAFQRSLDQCVGKARSADLGLTVLMMGVDDFKRTNAAFGYTAGDALLLKLALRLKAALGADDLVARVGGDEFAVILPGVANDADISVAVTSIVASVGAPCPLDGRPLNITISVGASTFPNQAASGAELLKNADIALYAAKRAGRGMLRLFQPAMRADAQERLSMLGLARDAITDDKIVANYQPKVDLRNGHVDGFEALLRWEHPRKGWQTPDTIAVAFQDRVLAAEISDRMIQSVICDMRRWANDGVEFGHVAVNAAAAEFRSGEFADKLLGQLHRANLPTSLFQLEVTETVFLGRGAEHIETTLRSLANAGIQIALDDFGTGYASLTHLHDFPISVLKIDRSFIRNLETNAQDAAIVRAVINLGRSLGIKIVAEGVETELQAKFLKKHRCHAGQGFLFSKAIPALDVASLITNWGRAQEAA